MKFLVRSAVILATFFYLYNHVTSSRIDASRDAMMFGTTADSSRTVHLRTDFASFYYASKAASRGGNMYDSKYLDSLAARDQVANHVLPYLYPPFIAIVAKSLGSLYPTTAQQVWDFLAIALFCVVVRFAMLTVPSTSEAMVRRGGLFAAIAALLLVVILPFRTNLDFGQINFLVLFFLSASFYFYFTKRSDIWAGVMLGLAALIKVTPALFVVFFLVSKRWKALAGFVVGVIGFAAATIALNGTVPWQQFLAFLSDMGYAKNVIGGFHPSIIANFSVAGFFMRLMPGEAQLIRLLTMSSLIVMFGVLLYHQLKYRSEQTEFTLVLPYLVFMVIASPVTWLHHLVYLFLGFLFALRAIWIERRDGRLRWVILLLLIAFGAMYEFQPFYSKLSVNEAVRPWVTSLNLFLLLVLFVLSLPRKGSLLVKE